MLHHLKRHLLIEIVKECFSQACLHCMRKTQIHTAFKRYTVLCHTAYMVQIYNMRSAAAVKTIKFRKLFIKFCTADTDKQSFSLVQIEPLIFVFGFAVYNFGYRDTPVFIIHFQNDAVVFVGGDAFLLICAYSFFDTIFSLPFVVII